MKWGIFVNKRGFTLVETMMGLFLLGLIAVIVLPIINSSFIKLRNHRTKMEMIYIGEMAVEKIKAFNEDSTSEVFIYDTRVFELIELFRLHDYIETSIPIKTDNEKYSLKIIKDKKSEYLWTLSIFVYHNIEGSNISHVEYNAYLPQK